MMCGDTGTVLTTGPVSARVGVRCRRSDESLRMGPHHGVDPSVPLYSC